MERILSPYDVRKKAANGLAKRLTLFAMRLAFLSFLAWVIMSYADIAQGTAFIDAYVVVKCWRRFM